MPTETGRHLLAMAQAKMRNDRTAYDAHWCWLRTNRPDLAHDVITARMEEAGQLRLVYSDAS